MFWLFEFATGYSQIHFVVALIVQFILTRQLSAESFINVFYQVPLFVSIFNTIVRDPYMIKFRRWRDGFDRIIQPDVGRSAYAYATCVELGLDVFMGVVFLQQQNSLLIFPFMCLMRVLSLRLVYIIEWNRLLEGDMRNLVVSNVHTVVATFRQCILLCSLLYPNNMIWGLWVSVFAYAIETYILFYAVPWFYGQCFNRPPKSISTWSGVFRDWFEAQRHLPEAFKTTLFHRGEQWITSFFVSTETLRDYVIISNTRHSLTSLILRPVYYLTHRIFLNSKSDNISLRTYLVAWVVFALIMGSLAPLLAWPILYLYGGDQNPSLFDRVDLLGAMVIMLSLFVFEVGDAIVTSYCTAYKRKPINFWFDFVGSLIYLALSIHILQNWGIRGSVFAILFPIAWRTVFRGPWN